MRSIIFANYMARDTMRLSPTLDVAVVQESASVSPASTHMNRLAVGAQLHVGQVIAHLVQFVAALCHDEAELVLAWDATMLTAPVFAREAVEATQAARDVSRGGRLVLFPGRVWGPIHTTCCHRGEEHAQLSGRDGGGRS